MDAEARGAASEPAAAEILRAALELPEASLVILRRRLLVEFKTADLGPGLQRYREGEHVSWQVGDFDGHHCHLALDKIARVVFAAEPSGCQGGRLNYTVWFETADDAGNPFRPNGYFSITLNRPYETGGAPRREVIEPVLRLWRRFEGHELTAAEPAFLSALAELEPHVAGA